MRKITFASVSLSGFAVVLAGAATLASETSQASGDRSVAVFGNCVRSVTSDRGAIVVTAEFTDRDLRAAAKRATEAYDKTRDAVKKLSLDDLELKTSEYQVAEQREWETGKSVFKGYRARMGMRISTSEIERIGEVIALASQHGLRDVGSLTTYLSDEKTKKEQFACLKTAAENARAKADQLVGPLGAHVSELLNVAEVGTSDPGRRPPFEPAMAQLRAASASDSMAPPTVEAGNQEIRTTVQAVFKIQ